jgi:imidazolonepropionase-like amidohydrolase
VIRNGRVFDGGGNPWIRADVAIKAGRVARIGLVTGRGTKEIDATGRYVSPGWIDMMDQSASILSRNGNAENKVMMGVTTALSGEGGTPVPPTGIAASSGGRTPRKRKKRLQQPDSGGQPTCCCQHSIANTDCYPYLERPAQ